MANITTDAYQKKTWTDNDIVTADDINNIENGVSNNNTGLRNVQERATILESRASDLELKATDFEKRINQNTGDISTLNEQLNNDENGISIRLNEVETQMYGTDAETDPVKGVLNRLTEVENLLNGPEDNPGIGIVSRLTAVETKVETLKSSFDSLNNIAVTSYNLKNYLGDHLKSEGTTYYNIIKDGVSYRFSIEKKNSNAEVIIHKYYKRDSTLKEPIVFNVNFPSDTFSGYRYKTYELCDVDTSKTNDMSMEDLKRFASFRVNSGICSTTESIYIENNKVMCKIGVLGGGFLIPVHLDMTVSFGAFDDELYQTY